MRRLSEKLLAILLSALLAWSAMPLAAVSPPAGAMTFAPSASVSIADVGETMDHATMDCDHCDRSGACVDGCSGGHCASCALSVVPLAIFHRPAIQRLGRVFPNEGIATRLPSSLFRPPRV